VQPLSGIFAPVVTTFDERSGDLAREPFVANVRAHLAAGIDGIVVAGSTGEAALLTEEERARLVEWARAAVPADRLLMAGVGGESTRITVQRVRAAAERGAAAALVVAPHYYAGAMTSAALRSHYARVADESPIPVVLYNIPKYMHFSLEPSLVMELARHENIMGIKDSSGDLELLAAYLTAQSDRFSVLTGSGQGLHPALERGARGGILAVALFASDATTGANSAVELYSAWRSGRRDAAAQVQQRLTPLAREIVGTRGVPGVKAAMDIVSLHGGPVRAPLMPLPESDRARVAELLGVGRVAGVA
jgi:4-hydroxy-2-oxoglutarate aldolase